MSHFEFCGFVSPVDLQLSAEKDWIENFHANDVAGVGILTNPGSTKGARFAYGSLEQIFIDGIGVDAALKLVFVLSSTIHKAVF